MIQKLSFNEQPSFQASKWLQIPALLEISELKSLFEELGGIRIVQISGVSEQGGGIIPRESFLNAYGTYLSALKKGILPDKADYGVYFNSAISASLNDFYAVEVGEGKQLIRLRKPVIQLKEHTLDYSPYDQKIRSMVLGSEAVTWGLQFSFPQLYEEPETRDIVNVLASGDYPNGRLFRLLQKWMRRHTSPTPFEAEGKTIKSPIRLGKECFDWINNHPQLKKKNLKVGACHAD